MNNDILEAFKIGDRIIQVEGFKKGRKGEVVENPYDGDEKSNKVGVLWDDNPSIGIQGVSPFVIKLDE
jgi:hypothetical protein